MEAPNSKLQAPEKHQVSSSNPSLPRNHRGEIGFAADGGPGATVDVCPSLEPGIWRFPIGQKKFPRILNDIRILTVQSIPALNGAVYMNHISSITETFLRVVLHDPARLMPILAYACVVTMIIAIISDTLLRKRELARQRKSAENLPKLPAAKTRLHSSER